jgi:hypothetical protein
MSGKPIDWDGMRRAARNPEKRALISEQLEKLRLQLDESRRLLAETKDRMQECKRNGWSRFAVEAEQQQKQLQDHVQFFETHVDGIERALRLSAGERAL